MRRTWIFVLGMALALSLPGCGEDHELIPGTYRFEKVLFLSPISSSTKDYINSMNEDTEYLIHEDVFRITGPEGTMELESPEYIKEEMQGASGFKDLDKLFQDSDSTRYTIFDKEGKRTRWSLYVTRDSLWVGKHIDAPNGQEITFDLYSIRKTGP